MTTAAQVVAVAQAQVGTAADANNGTPYSDWYQATHPLAGNDFRGEDWCAMFVSWCFAQAGLDLHFAWCPTGVDMYRAYGLFDRSPRAGDVVFYDWAADGTATHTGLVESIDSDGTVHTIEGNRGTPSEVARHTIPQEADWSVVLGFGHPNYAVTAPEELHADLCDSAFGPAPAQLEVAKQAGISCWAWYVAGAGAFHVWSDDEVAVLAAGGIATSRPIVVPRLDLTGDPVAEMKEGIVRAKALGWHGCLAIDTEASMRGNPRLRRYVDVACEAIDYVGWVPVVYGGGDYVPDGVAPWWIEPGRYNVPLRTTYQFGQHDFAGLAVDLNQTGYLAPVAAAA